MKLGPSSTVAYSSEGRLLAVVRARGVEVLATSAPRVRRRVKVKHPSHVGFSLDGTRIVAKTTSGDLFTWATEDDAPEPHLVRSGESEGAAPSFSACGRFVVDGSWNGRVELVRVDDGATVWSEAFPSEMLIAVSAARDRHTWAFLHSPKATRPDAPPAPDYLTMRTYPFQDHGHRIVAPGLAFVRSMALSPDGATVAMAHGAPPDALSLVDALTGEVWRRVSIHGGGTSLDLAWSADGTRLASVQKDQVRIYSQDLVLLAEISLRYAAGVAFSPDGRDIALASWEAGVTLPLAEVLTAPATGAQHGNAADGAARRG
jgi:WD40 repeat protein